MISINRDLLISSCHDGELNALTLSADSIPSDSVQAKGEDNWSMDDNASTDSGEIEALRRARCSINQHLSKALG